MTYSIKDSFDKELVYRQSHLNCMNPLEYSEYCCFTHLSKVIYKFLKNNDITMYTHNFKNDLSLIIMMNQCITI